MQRRKKEKHHKSQDWTTQRIHIFSHFLFHTWLSGGHVTGVSSVRAGHIG